MQEQLAALRKRVSDKRKQISELQDTYQNMKKTSKYLRIFLNFKIACKDAVRYLDDTRPSWANEEPFTYRPQITLGRDSPLSPLQSRKLDFNEDEQSQTSFSVMEPEISSKQNFGLLLLVIVVIIAWFIYYFGLGFVKYSLSIK